jgi:hypothetical protein
MQVRTDQNHWSIAGAIRRISAITWTVVVLWLVSAAPAQAASVSYILDQSNRFPDGANYLKVTIDDEGQAGAINFHLETLDSLVDLACAKFSILKFGFNGDEIGKNNIVGLPDGWKIKHDKKMDGFGKFENVLIGKKWNGLDSLSFSIIGIDDDNIYSYVESHDAGDGVFFSTYVNGIERKKHHGYGKWYGEWYTSNCHRCTKGGYFGGGGELTPVPVPGAVWLLGSGLIGLVRLAGRKRNKTT